MARYSEQEKMELRRVSIAEVMSMLGKRTDHDRGSMYYSPFREENTPSFWQAMAMIFVLFVISEL